jgi:D-3-phosphoglycerate dehydrogenase
MIRLLVAEARDFSPEAVEILGGFGTCDLRQLDRAQLLETLPDYDVLWVRLGLTIDREIIDAASRLKVIVTATTGVDHIDLDYALRRNIEVLSLRGETQFLDSIPATAEHTWGLLLALNRRIPWAFRSVCHGQWDRDRFRGHDLRGQTLGIIGLGRLGIQVARFGLVFGMRVLAFDPYRQVWPSDVIRCASLEALLSLSNVVSLHVPLNSETTGLIGTRELQLMRPGAILLNTSRGAVVDAEALLEALASGHLGGAALDVIPDERDEGSVERQRLLEYAANSHQLLITPHIGGATFESMAATEVFMCRKLVRFFTKAAA